MNKSNGEPSESVTATSLERLRQFITLIALGLALAHMIWPAIAIDAITLGLLVIAVLPWLAPLIKSLELPGGWKVELQEIQKLTSRAENVGLLSTPLDASQPEYSFLAVANSDPILALAGLRIELERRLNSLTEKHQIRVPGEGTGPLLRTLSRHEILSREQLSVLHDLFTLLNAAIHGASVDARTSEWAMDVGPRLLKGLDERIEASNG